MFSACQFSQCLVRNDAPACNKLGHVFGVAWLCPLLSPTLSAELFFDLMLSST